MEMTEQVLCGQCSVCGRVTELLELPEGQINSVFRAARSCNGHFVRDEIDAATVAGRGTDARSVI